MFKPGDLVTLEGDASGNVYTLTTPSVFYATYVEVKIGSHRRLFDKTTGNYSGGEPDFTFKRIKHHDASEPLPPTPLDLAQQQVSGGTKPTNPKDAIGSDKIPLHLWPSTATVLGCMAGLDGMLKYGRMNWRVAGVRASIYTDAIERHLHRMKAGEWIDSDSGVPHIGHILYDAGIIADAYYAGKLNADWEVQGGLTKLIEEMTTHVKRLKELHKDKNPYHYTCKDNEVDNG